MNADLPITEILARASAGDPTAINGLIPRIYATLRRLAHRQRSYEPAHTLDTTALVHEAYLQLANKGDVSFADRAHLYAYMSQAMRHILVDYARSKQSTKRGGNEQRTEFDEAVSVSNERANEIVALDDALIELAGVDPRKARVVEMRYFGGLSVEETAKVLNISTVTVMRDWSLAKAWLYRELSK